MGWVLSRGLRVDGAQQQPNSANSHLSLFVRSSAKFNQKLQTKKSRSIVPDGYGGLEGHWTTTGCLGGLKTSPPTKWREWKGLWTRVGQFKSLDTIYDLILQAPLKFLSHSLPNPIPDSSQVISSPMMALIRADTSIHPQ